MKPCKRLEIVVEKPLSRHVARELVALGAPGYTLIGEASGRGDRGDRRADDPTGTSTNCIFIIACAKFTLPSTRVPVP